MCSILHAWANLYLFYVLWCSEAFRFCHLSLALLLVQKWQICPKNCVQIYMIRLILTLQNEFWGVQSTSGVSIYHQMSELVKNNQKNFHQICPSEIGLLPYFINFWLENLVKWSKRPIFGRKFWWKLFWLFCTNSDVWWWMETPGVLWIPQNTFWRVRISRIM